jgi:Ca2+-binding RTX toxin-like protein
MAGIFWRLTTRGASGERCAAATALSALLIALVAILCISPRGVSAAACPDPATTSDGGAVLYVSPCAGEITISSPEVEVVYGSAGDDVINAGLNVETIYTGEGDDVVYAGAETSLVEAGPGEDTIYGEPLENELGADEVEAPEIEYEPAAPAQSAVPQDEASATASTICLKTRCLGGVGDQELHGEGGNDEIFGERGNDELFGEQGNDALYGGVGDDGIFGGVENDFLAGGGGADLLEGEAGDDVVRGDGTIDTIKGNEGIDTLSFATGVTPGFEGAYPSSITHVSGFPESESGERRGVFVRLDGGGTSCTYAACNNGAGLGGGADSVAEVENVIGTAFPDIIVGSSGANKIYGGGGGDVIIGSGGADELFGGAEGDYFEENSGGVIYGGKGTNSCVGTATKNECTTSTVKVIQHDTSTMSVGVMMVKNPAAEHDAVYLIGSDGEDKVNAHYDETEGGVSFTSYGSTIFSGELEGCTYESSQKVLCPLPGASPSLDAVVLAGMKGDDRLSVGGEPNFPLTTSPILLGGEGNDTLSGSGTTEDVLVDGNGSGADSVKAFGYDDWLLNNSGLDTLEGGMGNDLLLSTTTCDGDTLQGGETGKDDGEARNDASWAKLPAPTSVTASIETQSSGSYYNESVGKPACSTGTTNNLYGIDDLSGSPQGDALFGGSGPNLLTGHLGEDNLRGEGGNDSLDAKDSLKDKVSGGSQTEGGADECIVDLSLDEVSGCEKTFP